MRFLTHIVWQRTFQKETPIAIKSLAKQRIKYDFFGLASGSRLISPNCNPQISHRSNEQLEMEVIKVTVHEVSTPSCTDTSLEISPPYFHQ